MKRNKKWFPVIGETVNVYKFKNPREGLRGKFRVWAVEGDRVWVGGLPGFYHIDAIEKAKRVEYESGKTNERDK